MKDKETVTAHDPKNIKREIFTKEKERIMAEEMHPESRLFHYYKTKSLVNRDLELEAQQFLYKQQDSKDFFLSLEGNAHKWYDVYLLFKYTPHSYSECRECGHLTQQENVHSMKLVVDLDIPPQGHTMAQHVENHLNRPTIMADGWTCENDPRHNTLGGNNYKKIKDINEVQFLVFVMERLKWRIIGPNYMDGEQYIDHTKAEAGGHVQVVDSNGVSGTLMLIAVIHHDGVSVDNETSGHYMADILDPQTQQWFSTSDDQTPALVNQPSNEGYIYIYKKL